MNNGTPVEDLTKEIQNLKRSIQELTNQVRQLQLDSKAGKVPGVFEVGDKVIILSNGLIGKTGDKATVTSVGKRVRLKVREQHTNRSRKNLKHDEH
jgi:transcription antitermination factor NusG